MNTDEVKQAKIQRLAEWIETRPPAMVLVDHYPFATEEELRDIWCRVLMRFGDDVRRGVFD